MKPNCWLEMSPLTLVTDWYTLHKTNTAKSSLIMVITAPRWDTSATEINCILSKWMCRFSVPEQAGLTADFIPAVSGTISQPGSTFI